jgi:hypothetical protein
MLFYLFEDEVDLVLQLLLSMQYLMLLLLVDQVTVYVRTPDDSVSRDQPHQIHPVLHYHINEDLQLQLGTPHLLPRAIHLHL